MIAADGARASASSSTRRSRSRIPTPARSCTSRPSPARSPRGAADVNVGFIGLGHLGHHLAASLLRAGFPLTVHDRVAGRRAALVAAGATCRAHAAGGRGGHRCVITCLPSPAAVSEVVAGAGRPARGPAPRRHLDRHEHERHARARRLAALAAERGIATLEARSPAACTRRRRARSRSSSAATRRSPRRTAASRRDGGRGLPRRAARHGLGDQGDHQHARLHPPRGRRRGADAGEARRPRLARPTR